MAPDIGYSMLHHDDIRETSPVDDVPVLEADGSIREWASVYSDMTGRKLAERWLLVQYGVSRLLGEVDNLEEATLKILQIIGEGLEWERGAFWIVNRELDKLDCHTIWCASS